MQRVSLMHSKYYTFGCYGPRHKRWNYKCIQFTQCIKLTNDFHPECRNKSDFGLSLQELLFSHSPSMTSLNKVNRDHGRTIKCEVLILWSDKSNNYMFWVQVVFWFVGWLWDFFTCLVLRFMLSSALCVIPFSPPYNSCSIKYGCFSLTCEICQFSD